MHLLINKLRTQYFQATAKLVNHVNCQFVVLTHILNDRHEFLAAINSISPISLVIAIPYSTDQSALRSLKTQYNIVTPTLKQLKDCDYLCTILKSNVTPKKPTILIEIGGYFAQALKNNNHLTKYIVGVIEDTEVGHREYEKMRSTLQIPVVSIARSQLKEAEDYLVGPSCVYTVEKILRKFGLLIYGKRSLVLGFGRVGRGLAYILTKNNCPVSICDTNPIMTVKAVSEGFRVVNMTTGLQNAEIIYGATGTTSIKKDDFKLIKPGALLVSCGSKDIEFDLTYLKTTYKKTAIDEHLDRYSSYNDDHFFYLVANGRPVNFIDSAVIGPALALTQAEIIFAINNIIKLSAEQKKGLFDTSYEVKQLLAHKWLECFCDESSGYYKHV